MRRPLVGPIAVSVALLTLATRAAIASTCAAEHAPDTPAWLVGLYETTPEWSLVCMGAVIHKFKVEKTPLVILATAAHCVSGTKSAVLLRNSGLKAAVTHGGLDSRARTVISRDGPDFLTEDLGFIRLEVSNEWFDGAATVGIAAAGSSPSSLRVWRQSQGEVEAILAPTASEGTLKEHLNELLSTNTRLRHGVGLVCPTLSLVKTNSGAPIVTADSMSLVGILSTVPIDADDAGPLPAIAQAEDLRGLKWSSDCWLAPSYNSGLTWPSLKKMESRCGIWKVLPDRGMAPPTILRESGDR